MCWFILKNIHAVKREHSLLYLPCQYFNNKQSTTLVIEKKKAM